MKLRYTPFLLGLILVASPLFAQTIIFDEAVDGDLSDLGTAPTPVTLLLGLNTIVGSFGDANVGGGSGATDGSDADYFTFTLSPSQIVTAISTTREGPDGPSFLGQANASTITGVSGSSQGNLDAGSLFDNGPLVNDAVGGGLGIPAVNIPLSPGPQTFLLQETARGAFDYSITFTVSTIPEPSNATLMGGLALCGFLRRRRS